MQIKNRPIRKFRLLSGLVVMVNKNAPPRLHVLHIARGSTNGQDRPGGSIAAAVAHRFAKKGVVLLSDARHQSICSRCACDVTLANAACDLDTFRRFPFDRGDGERSRSSLEGSPIRQRMSWLKRLCDSRPGWQLADWPPPFSFHKRTIRSCGRIPILGTPTGRVNQYDAQASASPDMLTPSHRS